jgi:proline iminopeptidase
VLLDQRGCGRSTPAGCLVGNTTAALVEDLEALRRALAVQEWAAVLGGSWGVTLALAYAQAHPAAVGGLVLRGICLMRPAEVAWMFGGGSSSYNPSAAGAAVLRPLAWSRFLEQLPLEERREPLLGYYSRLLSSDERVRADAVRLGVMFKKCPFSCALGGAAAVWQTGRVSCSLPCGLCCTAPASDDLKRY